MPNKSHNAGGDMDTNKKIMLGAGVAALAAAAAGAYFLYGTEAGKKKRKEIRSWMLKAQADVLQKMENLKEINEEVYNKIVTEVAEKYKALKEVDQGELVALAANLRSQWKNIKRSFDTHSKGPAKRKARTARTPKKKGR